MARRRYVHVNSVDVMEEFSEDRKLYHGRREFSREELPDLFSAIREQYGDVRLFTMQRTDPLEATPTHIPNTKKRFAFRCDWYFFGARSSRDEQSIHQKECQEFERRGYGS